MEIAMGAIDTVLPKLDDLHVGFPLEKHVRKSIKSLRAEFNLIHATLGKLARVPLEQLDEGVKIWVGMVSEFSYKMVDIIDAFVLHVEDGGDSTNPKNRVKKLLKKTIKLFKKGRNLHCNALEEAVGQAKALAKPRQRYEEQILGTDVGACVDPPVMALYTDVTELIGIEDSRDKLINMLDEGDDWSKTVSVVGSGGLGKTSLAKAVYGKIRGQFDCATFVLVSWNPDMKKVFQNILYELDKNKYAHIHCVERDEKQLIDEIIEFLDGKRYLIVIDDIWNEKEWQLIKCAFSQKNNLGSRIVITTCIVSVSEECCSSSNDIYQMEPLSDDDSQKLLYDRMFGSVSRCPCEFEQVSSYILMICGGVPSTIIAMASVLAGDPWMKPKDEWDAFLKYIGHGFMKGGIRGIMSLSYYDLPTHLKPCLLFLSTFPVTHMIEKNRLVKKLIAEGIVNQGTKLIGSLNEKEAKLNQEFSLQEVASQYLDELVSRNVIYPLECKNNGEVISYHIHPVMHEFLKSIAIEDKLAAWLDDIEDISRAHCMDFHHLSIHCPDSENLIGLSSMNFGGGFQSLTVFGHAKRFLRRHFKDTLSSTAFDGNVHSLTVFGHANRLLLGHFKGTRGLDLEGCKSIVGADVGYICSMVLLKQLCLAKTQITELPPQIGNLQCLEGLDVGGTQITELPPQIGNLQCLERLDVGGTQITELPPQIGKLQNLQTLDARKSRVKDLPDEVVLLTRLVHLLIGDNESCEGVKLPEGIGKLTSLQQLCTIDLRKCPASSLEELVELPCLKEIAVVASDEPEDTTIKNALFSSLNKSTKKRSLVVCSDFRLSTLQLSSPYKYLNYWKKHIVPRFLKVPIGFAGKHFLCMLDIRVCKLEEEDLKILRELPRLQSLIVRLEVLRTTMVRISCEGFAKLVSFYVDCRMPRVVLEEGAMPKLEHLELKLYGGTPSEENVGIEHLLSLQKVTLRYSKWYATNKGVRETTDAVKTECKEHQNEITLCIAEEEKNDTCNMKTEIFQENKDASCGRMTEIKQEDGHADGTGYLLSGDGTQEGGLHQSIHDSASCSGTKGIEEVVE